MVLNQQLTCNPDAYKTFTFQQNLAQQISAYYT